MNDFVVTDSFEKEFKRIPEMKESVNRMESSKLDSKRHTFKWQWDTANNICDNLESSKVNSQLLKGCDPNAAQVNTAAVGAGRKPNPLTDAQWQEKREKYKDVACPKATTGVPCTFHAEGKCFYSHSANVIAKAKSKPAPKGKAKAKGKGKDD